MSPEDKLKQIMRDEAVPVPPQPQVVHIHNSNVVIDMRQWYVGTSIPTVLPANVIRLRGHDAD